MSARVFNPHFISEMRRVMRGGGHLDLSEIEIQSPRDNVSTESVRRCLFGPVDHEQCKIDVEREMEAHWERASKKWNFDFKTGKPRPLEEGCIYEWKVVKPNEPVPKPYAFTRLPYLNQHADNTAALKSGLENSQSCPSSSSSITSATPSVRCNKQTVITDFMRKQKTMRRISSSSSSSSSGVKSTDSSLSSAVGEGEEPAKKRARTCSS